MQESTHEEGEGMPERTVQLPLTADQRAQFIAQIMVYLFLLTTETGDIDLTKHRIETIREVAWRLMAGSASPTIPFACQLRPEEVQGIKEMFTAIQPQCEAWAARDGFLQPLEHLYTSRVLLREAEQGMDSEGESRENDGRE